MSGPNSDKLAPPYNNRANFHSKYTGSCYCKAVRFAVSQDCLDSMYCHCETCQTLHGCPYQWAAVLPKDALQFHPDALEHLSWYHSPTQEMANKVEDRRLPCKLSCNKCRAPLMDEGRNMMLMLPVYLHFPREDNESEASLSHQAVASEADAKEAHESDSGRKRIPRAWQAKHHMYYGKRVADMRDGLTKYLSRKGQGTCDDEGHVLTDEGV